MTWETAVIAILYASPVVGAFVAGHTLGVMKGYQVAREAYDFAKSFGVGKQSDANIPGSQTTQPGAAVKQATASQIAQWQAQAKMAQAKMAQAKMDYDYQKQLAQYDALVKKKTP